MKVLITTDWYEPAVNGVVTSVLNLKKELEQRGNDVKVLTLAQGGAEPGITDDVTFLPSIDASRVYPDAILRYPKYKKYIRHLIDWSPDIVHSQCEISTYRPARFIARVCGAPIIHTYHTVYEYYAQYLIPGNHLSHLLSHQMAKQFSKRTVNKFDHVITPSKKVEDLLRTYGITKPISVIPTGIEVERFASIPDSSWILEKKDKLGIPVDATVLISIGRLAQEKNLSEILDFMRDLREENVYFLVVGDGPFRPQMEKIIADYGIGDRVVFTGRVNPSEVNNYYHLGDLFVNASISETQGLTYIEALSAGVPLLCRKDSCLDGIVDNGINGWQYQDREDFLGYLDMYCGEEELRAHMKGHVRANRMRFSTGNFAEAVIKIYEELVADKTRKDL